MTRIHFVGSISPYEEAINPEVSIAGNRCQLGILDGLKCDNEIVQVISLRANKIFPLGKKIYIPGFNSTYNGLSYSFIAYLNLPFFRELFVNVSTLFGLLRRVKRNDVILYYNALIPFAFGVFILRKLLKIKIYVLACDVHVPGQTVSHALRWHYRYLKQKFVLSNVDGVIAVTKNILIDFKCRGNAMIMEGGISKDLLEVEYDSLKVKKGFKILYAGALNKLNGVDLLLAALNKLNNPDVQLIIAGGGELSEAVKLAASKDKRIVFLGLIPHKEVVRLYQDISLLVCIRITREIHTSYFFPSKLVEYISTGIPVLSTNIESWTFNLSDFCNILMDETVDDLVLAINECIEHYPAIKAKAALGKSHVRSEMLWSAQGKKISKFLANESTICL